VENIGEILSQTLTLVPLEHISDSGKLFGASSVLLLDNIRQDPGEEKNSDELANKLVQGFDLYVNDAFSVSHRKHASVSAVAGKLPAYGGLLIKKEIEGLSKALNAPVQGKTVILGGAKIATKLPVIENFLDKAEKILVGGAIANNFFKANGINVGASLVDDGTLSIKNLDMNKIVLPVDALVSDDKGGNGNVRSVDLKNPDISAQESILDIGKETIFNFSEIINSSVMVVWNGPMGLNEVERFKNGTNIIAEAVSKVGYSVIGGGDTVAALPEVLKSKFTFISTGGGAMLDFLAGKTMPGLVALGYQE
jgi:phosphoglycerate kinase